MVGYATDIEATTLANTKFREVVFTGPHVQLVVMALPPGQDIGLETHANVDQFIHVEAGHGMVKLYTIYSPPEHPAGTVHETKAEAEAYERKHHR